MFELGRTEKKILDRKKRNLREVGLYSSEEELVQREKDIIDILESRRRFLIDRRESWLPKTIWNLIIPMVVSIFTTIATFWIVKLWLH